MSNLTPEELDLLTFDDTELTDDESGEEQAAVDELDALALGTDQPLKLPRRVTLGDVEDEELERERELAAERKGLRARGGTRQTVGEYGVRGDQQRELPSPEVVAKLREEGDLSLLEPYRREGGFDASRDTMSTSYQRNAEFRASLHSNTTAIDFGRLVPRIVKVSGASAIESFLLDDGVTRSSGGEYSLFIVQLDARDSPIYSVPDLELSIDMTARLGRVERDMRSLKLFTLSMQQAHAVLLDNATFGAPVRIAKPTPIEIVKQSVKMEDNPYAHITGANFRYTFRFDTTPEVNKWRLTAVQWWMRRNHLMGVRDAKSGVYFNATIELNGSEIDRSRVQALWTEDDESNSLAPSFELEIFPGREAFTGRLFPLVRDQSIVVRIEASTEILVPQPQEPGTAPKTPARTYWEPLPELSFQIRNTSDLLRDAIPRRGRVNYTFRRDRVPLDDADEVLDSARGLTATDVEFRLADDEDEFRRDGELLAIDSFRLGPLSLSAVRQAVSEGRKKLSFA